MFELVNAGVLLLLAIATLMPVLRIRHWFVRAFDFPRLQILIALILLAVFAASSQTPFGRPMPGIWWCLLLALVLNHLWWIWPYSILHSKQVPDADSTSGPTLVILTSNVLMTNRASKPLLDMVQEHSPDIIALLESDRWWQEQFDDLSDYPYRMACPMDNKYGMHLYSKLEIKNTHIDFLVEDDVPSMRAEVQLPGKYFVQLHLVHPRPPAPTENEYSTARDVELLVLAKALENIHAPIIVMGDLNDVAWSRTTRLFRRVSKLLDPRTGRGFYNTFNANHWFARWPLDHVFVSTHFRVSTIKRLAHMGSDHFPMLVELAMTSPDVTKEPSQPNEDEKELIDDTLQTSLANKTKDLQLSQR